MHRGENVKTFVRFLHNYGSLRHRRSIQSRIKKNVLTIRRIIR